MELPVGISLSLMPIFQIYHQMKIGVRTSEKWLFLPIWGLLSVQPTSVDNYPFVGMSLMGLWVCYGYASGKSKIVN